MMGNDHQSSCDSVQRWIQRTTMGKNHRCFSESGQRWETIIDARSESRSEAIVTDVH